MKFGISVSDFQYAMRLVKDVVPSTGALLESKGVLISAHGDRATFTAYSPQLQAKAVVNIDGKRDGEAVVDASALWGAIARFQPRNDHDVGTSDITVSKSPKARKLTIAATTRYKGGAEAPHRRVFSLLNPEFFPEVPSPTAADFSIRIPAPVLMDGIDSVSYAVSIDKSRAILTGISVCLADGTLTFAATDGICLAEHIVSIEHEGEPMKLVLPATLANKIARSFFDNDMLELALTSGCLFVSTSNLVLAGTLIGEEYPAYRGIMPFPTEFIQVDKHIFMDNLLNLSYRAPEVEDSRVSVSVAGGSLSLSCGGSTNSELDTDYKGTLSFDCDLKRLVLSVRNIPGDFLRIGVPETTTEPLHFSSEAEDHAGATLVCVLVPLSRN